MISNTLENLVTSHETSILIESSRLSTTLSNVKQNLHNSITEIDAVIHSSSPHYEFEGIKQAAYHIFESMLKGLPNDTARIFFGKSELERLRGPLFGNDLIYRELWESYLETLQLSDNSLC